MYKCDKHGRIDSNWCDECEKLVQCDCSEIESSRVKDVIYDCEDGERTISITIQHCKTCGAVFDVGQK